MGVEPGQTARMGSDMRTLASAYSYMPSTVETLSFWGLQASLQIASGDQKSGS